MRDPQYTCLVCRRVVMVTYPGRAAFPPDAARRKLIKLCRMDGHKAIPVYAAGLR